MAMIPSINSGFNGCGTIGRMAQSGGLAAANQLSTGTIGTDLGANAASSIAGAGNVASEVAELLQNIGGGAENNQLLEAIIALLILMALLQSSASNQTASQSGEELLRALSAGSGGVSDSSMSVSLHIEQTTVTMTSASNTSLSTGLETSSSGQQIDLLA